MEKQGMTKIEELLTRLSDSELDKYYDVYCDKAQLYFQNICNVFDNAVVSDNLSEYDRISKMDACLETMPAVNFDIEFLKAVCEEKRRRKDNGAKVVPKQFFGIKDYMIKRDIKSILDGFDVTVAGYKKFDGKLNEELCSGDISKFSDKIDSFEDYTEEMNEVDSVINIIDESDEKESVSVFLKNWDKFHENSERLMTAARNKLRYEYIKEAIDSVDKHKDEDGNVYLTLDGRDYYLKAGTNGLDQFLEAYNNYNKSFEIKARESLKDIPDPMEEQSAEKTNEDDVHIGDTTEFSAVDNTEEVENSVDEASVDAEKIFDFNEFIQPYVEKGLPAEVVEEIREASYLPLMSDDLVKLLTLMADKELEKVLSKDSTLTDEPISEPESKTELTSEPTLEPTPELEATAEATSQPEASDDTFSGEDSFGEEDVEDLLSEGQGFESAVDEPSQSMKK